MANYESPRYPALGFYVDGVFRRFSGGHYATEDSAEIAVLDALTDVSRVDEPKKDPEEPQKDEKATEEPQKPAPKAPRKAANASAK